MKRFLSSILLAALLHGGLSAQSTVEAVLASISTNNKLLQAQVRHVEAQKAGLKTGLAPDDPTVGLDYMIGSPATAGNQTDFTLTQALDFPTVYAQRRALASEMGRQVDFGALVMRQQVLLQGKRLCIDIVFHRKRQQLLQKRMARVETLRADYQRKLDGGDGNILDFNKVRLQVATLRQAIQANDAEMDALALKLVELNGGLPLVFADTVYPALEEVGPLPQLEAEVEVADPLVAALTQDVAVAQEALALSKALKLPRMEVGYHYQGILGQTYNGVHAGLSLPLWERRHTVEAQEAAILVANADLEEHHNEHLYHTRAYYARYQSLQASLAELDTLVADLNSEPLLAKALTLGEISVITYLMELGFFDEAQDQLLEVEHSLHTVAAEMLQHRLLGR
jgi:outer membrane protein, heavy metal efflux system